MSDLIERQAAIDVLQTYYYDTDSVIYKNGYAYIRYDQALQLIGKLPSVEPEIAENLYLCKCYITDKDGLQHEVIHTGDIRRVTGWEI